MDDETDIKELARYRLGREKGGALAWLFVSSLLRAIGIVCAFVFLVFFFTDTPSLYMRMLMLLVALLVNSFVHNKTYTRRYNQLLNQKIAEIRAEDNPTLQDVKK
ncbi:MAG: hypothetical protein V4490_00530 [Pseudomonadota bacterium]